MAEESFQAAGGAPAAPFAPVPTPDAALAFTARISDPVVVEPDSGAGSMGYLQIRERRGREAAF